MTTEKMTIHKALVELKTIESRIIKATDAMPFRPRPEISWHAGCRWRDNSSRASGFCNYQRSLLFSHYQTGTFPAPFTQRSHSFASSPLPAGVR